LHRRIGELTPHPKNFEIYGQESVTDDLLASVKSKGVMVPLTITSENVIISGHRRYEAAKMAGLEIVPVGIATFESELDELEAIIEFNRQREKTFVQKMKEAETLEAIEAQRAKNRMAAAGASAAPGKAAGKGKEILPDLSQGQTRDKVAQQTGIGSGKTYEVAKKIWNKAKEGDEAAQDVVSRIEKGELTIHGAKKELEKEQKVEQKRQERDVKNAEIMKIIESGALEHVSEFEIVLADPPWRYDFSETECREIENNYPTATIEDICSHAPKTTPDSILFLWATAPKLREAMQVVDAWGFTYRTHAVWDKCKIGMGYWFRGQHELLIVATKGKASPPIAENRVSSIFKESRTEHSKKPDCVYEWIESAFVSYKKLEMYARSNRPGWKSWGAEA
jgi:N6-adenosine-specific RNA methylase IME4/ParB-like chromosome segregation protein Spo0J